MPRLRWRAFPERLLVLFTAALVLTSAETAEEARTKIVAAYASSLEALRRGDPDGAMQIDTDDWVSITVGQKPRSKRELEPFIRRDIASLKPPDSWSVMWNPEYETRGLGSGIQVYDFKLVGKTATVLCLVGSSRVEESGQTVWRGSHVRDTWVLTSAGWKRKLHEKLTVNERLVNGAAH